MDKKIILHSIEKLLKKAENAEHCNTEESLKIATEALELAKEHKLLDPMASAYVRIGRCHWINGSFEQAIEQLNRGLMICNQVHNEYVKVEALIGLGNVHIEIELFDQSLSFYNQGVIICENRGYTNLLSKLLNNLGSVHEEAGNIDKALEFYYRSLQETEKTNDVYAQAITSINVAHMLLQLNKVEKAGFYLDQAIEFGEENNKTLLLAHAYHISGKIYNKQACYKLSTEILRKAEIKAKESMDFNILFSIYLELGNTYMNSHKYSFAEETYGEALNIANEIGLTKLQLQVYEKLSILYKELNNIPKALEHFEKYLNTNQNIQENRIKERSKIIEYQTKLSSSIQETEVYRTLSNELKKSYNNLKILNDIGQTMTSTHIISDILNELYENINLLMKVDSLSVGLYDKKTKALRVDLSIEDGVPLENFKLSLGNRNSLMVYSFLNNTTIKLGDTTTEYREFIDEVYSTKGHLMPSAMYTPLEVEGEVIGVFTVQTRNKNVYTEADKILLQTLASYLAIALRNATKTIELAKLNRVLKAKSEQDGLTGIPNRHLFDERYNELWQESTAYDEMIGVMIVDIDNFKLFNDKYGHLVGDEVVKKVAKILNEQKRDIDFAARYGGDEFVVVLPKSSLESVNEYEMRIRNCISDINILLGIKDPVEVSIGVALGVSSEIDDKEKLIYIADNQLYESKSEGKNTISIRELK